MATDSSPTVLASVVAASAQPSMPALQRQIMMLQQEIRQLVVAASAQPSMPALQRQIMMLQQEIRQLRGSGTGVQGTAHSSSGWRHHGRAIKRLVTMCDNITDLINEADRRGTLGGGGHIHSQRESWLYKGYQELMRWIPGLQEWVLDPNNISELDSVTKQLTEGADAARSDDAAHLKTSIVTWLTPDPANPQLVPHDKIGRGLHNDATARSICPVEFDWDNMDHRDKIRDWHPRYLITANSWPRFLYKDGEYDPAHPAEGLFQGSLLVKAFQLIFTSPSSVANESVPNTNSNKRRHAERRTCANVASLLRMKKVEPWAIAYVAVQVRFALSSCGSWRLMDGIFDHALFYNNIVKWFEVTEDVEDQAFVDDLLLWWNKQVFGRENVLDYSSQSADKLSVAASFKRHRTDNAAACMTDNAVARMA